MARYGLVKLPPGGFRLVEDETADGHYIVIQAPTLAGDFTLTLPTALPDSTQALTVSSSGVMDYGDLEGSGSGLAVPVRNTIMNGPATWLVAGTGLQVLSDNGDAVGTIAEGFNATGGAVNRVFNIPDNTAWNSLPASSTSYLYVTHDGTTLTTGNGTLAPFYGSTTPGSPTTGQWWFNTSTYEGQTYNGSGWDAAPRVYVGQCTTNGSGVTEVVSYAYQGRAVVGGTVGLSANISYNHNLGTTLARLYGYYNNITGSSNTTLLPNGSGGYNINSIVFSSSVFGSSLRLDALATRLTSGSSAIYYDGANASFSGATAQIFVERNF